MKHNPRNLFHSAIEGMARYGTNNEVCDRKDSLRARAHLER